MDHPANESSAPAEAPAPKAKSSILKPILALLAIIVVGLIVFVAIQPSELHIERGIAINTPPEPAFVQVNDFHHWDAWSPWAKLDPNMKVTYEGPDSGEGAVYSWSGNSEVGEGRMTITESDPNQAIRIKLEFLKPFAATNTTQFTFTPLGDRATRVMWTMDGQNNFIAKAFGLFVDMKQMLNDEFDKGLSQLKVAAEAAAKKEAT